MVHGRHPERHKKNETVAGNGRKIAKFWAPTLRGPAFFRPISTSANFNFGQFRLYFDLGQFWGPRASKGGAEGWGNKRWGSEGWRARTVGAQNFAPFFFPLPPQFFIFPSLLVFFVEFWWCLKRRCAQMCTFGILGLSCETPAPTLCEFRSTHEEIDVTSWRSSCGDAMPHCDNTMHLFTQNRGENLRAITYFMKGPICRKNVQKMRSESSEYMWKTTGAFINRLENQNSELL